MPRKISSVEVIVDADVVHQYGPLNFSAIDSIVEKLQEEMLALLGTSYKKILEESGLRPKVSALNISWDEELELGSKCNIQSGLSFVDKLHFHQSLWVSKGISRLTAINISLHVVLVDRDGKKATLPKEFSFS